MDKGKIKNIIITVLLFVNAFLATIVIADALERRSYDAQTRQSLLAALETNGITLADESALEIDAIPVCTLSRNFSREERNVSAVLGSVTSSDLGGNVIMYYGRNGQACFRGTGDFEVLMETDSVPAQGDLAAASADFLGSLGIETSSDSASVSADSRTVTLRCSYKDRPIVNCRVSLIFSDACLNLVTGTAPLTAVSEGDDENIISTATAVMRFLETLSENGYVCSEIRNISQSYKMDVAASGEGTLTPLWHFETDIGDFYINAVSGRAESVAQND